MRCRALRIGSLFNDVVRKSPAPAPSLFERASVFTYRSADMLGAGRG